MKSLKIMIFLAALALCMALSGALAEDGTLDEVVVNMPASLRVIEESAFENTAFAAVNLPENVEYIGNRAFAGLANLKGIYVPASVQYIGKNAFAGQDDLIIIGISGSYAEDWANEHGYIFIHIDLWISANGKRIRIDPVFQLLRKQTPQDDNRESGHYYHPITIRSITDPKDKPEYYPVDYDFP